jgi:hypothetical protein
VYRMNSHFAQWDGEERLDDEVSFFGRKKALYYSDHQPTTTTTLNRNEMKCNKI